MTIAPKLERPALITTFDAFAQQATYSLMDSLNADPQSQPNGDDHRARQVFSGHYVPVTPTPIPNPVYIAHSHELFKELGLDDCLATEEGFQRVFSGDLSQVVPPMRPVGWATGYALSIYGTEYTHQCPFRTGNGYGDGRAVSVLEMVSLAGQRYEMQLKGGGPTPYCRGADGRAVLRSSVREFLAQEYMHALNVPTSRSLSLFASTTETVARPWYLPESHSEDPDIMTENPVAISTRVAPSFLRVGQLELFARRTRAEAHPQAREELKKIVEHLIEREYRHEIDSTLAFDKQIVQLALSFRARLTSLVANWLRVGYCQGNFNSDNCAAGGFTLDYGPFGFCEIFDPEFQPWTGGGQHFSFFNQPVAAQANFHMFWTAVRLLLDEGSDALHQLDDCRREFDYEMTDKVRSMWAAKFGLEAFDKGLYNQCIELMSRSEVDFTIFFRELSNVPSDISALKKSFYVSTSESLDEQWRAWLKEWRSKVDDGRELSVVSEAMKQVNPKYTWREWLVVPAYQRAAEGDYSLIQELQAVFSAPYEEHSQAIEDKYYRLKPKEFFFAGGVSHYSCSS